jgi:hypothetical protein
VISDLEKIIKDVFVSQLIVIVKVIVSQLAEVQLLTQG